MSLASFFGLVIFLSAISTFVSLAIKLEPYVTAMFRFLMNLPIPIALISSVILSILPYVKAITQNVLDSFEYLFIRLNPIMEAVIPVLNSTALLQDAYEKVHMSTIHDMISKVDPWLYVGAIVLLNIFLLVKYCHLHNTEMTSKNQKPILFEPKRSNVESFPVKWTELFGHESVRKIDVNWQLNDYIHSHPHVLVLFFIPWCEFCNNLLPSFAEAAALLESLQTSNVRLVAANCDINALISKAHAVESFPTMKYYRHGRFVMDVEKNKNFNLVNFLLEVTQDLQ